MSGATRRTTLLVLGVLIAATIVSPVQFGFVLMSPAIGVSYEAGVAGIVIMGWRHHGSTRFQVGKGQIRMSIHLVMASGLAIVASAAVEECWIPLRDYPWLGQSLRSPLAYVSLLLAVSVIAPMLEEALFRGYLLKRLRRDFGVATSVVISAIVFVIAHWDPTRATGEFATGIVMAIIVVRTERLWLAAIAHGITNLLGGLVYILHSINVPARLGVAYPALCALTAIVAAHRAWRILHDTDWHMPIA